MEPRFQAAVSCFSGKSQNPCCEISKSVNAEVAYFKAFGAVGGDVLEVIMQATCGIKLAVWYGVENRNSVESSVFHGKAENADSIPLPIGMSGQHSAPRFKIGR